MIVLLAVLALGSAAASAANTGADAPEAADPTASAPEAAPPPRAIPLSGIASAREQALRVLRNPVVEVNATDPAARFEDVLTQASDAIDARLRETQRLLDGLPTLDDLRAFDAVWRSQRSELIARSGEIERILVRLDARLQQLEGIQKRWQLTRGEARTTDFPPEIVESVDEVLTTAAREIEDNKRRQLALVSVQSRLATEQDRVGAALQVLQERYDQLVRDLFARTSGPLWQVTPPDRAGADRPSDFARSLDTDRARIATFSARNSATLGLQAGLFLLLAGALFFARRHVRSLDESDGPASLHVVQHPLALTLLLALLVTGWLYPEMPFLLGSSVFALALPAVIVIVRDYAPASMRPVLYALGAFYLLDLVRDVISPLPWISRVALTSEMLLVVAFGIWLLRPSRLAVLAGGEQLRGLRLTSIVMRVGLIMAFSAAVLEVAGYTPLAHLIGNGVLRSAYAALLLYAAVRAVHGLGAFALRRRPLRLSRMVQTHRVTIEQGLHRLLIWIAVGIGSWSALENFALWQPTVAGVGALLGARLELGEVSLSLGDLVAFGVTLWLSFSVAAAIRFLLDEEVFPRIEMARGVPYAISTLAGYSVLLLGFFFAAAVAGIDFNRFAILAGAFGVGIGFGLQNVVNNFVSGLILLFERPVQVGDTLQLQDVSGEVRHIGIRASTLRTWDGADVVVPNGELISQRVTNWTLNDRHRRIEIPVGIAYGSSPREIVALLRRTAEAAPDLLEQPAPQAHFMGFGESSLDFVLRAWTSHSDRWVQIRSELAMRVYDAIGDAGLEIPFPQRDLHLRSTPAPAKSPEPPEPGSAPDAGTDTNPHTGTSERGRP